jgi:hypothetical protein
MGAFVIAGTLSFCGLFWVGFEGDRVDITGKYKLQLDAVTGPLDMGTTGGNLFNEDVLDVVTDASSQWNQNLSSSSSPQPIYERTAESSELARMVSQFTGSSCRADVDSFGKPSGKRVRVYVIGNGLHKLHAKLLEPKYLDKYGFTLGDAADSDKPSRDEDGRELVLYSTVGISAAIIDIIEGFERLKRNVILLTKSDTPIHGYPSTLLNHRRLVAIFFRIHFSSHKPGKSEQTTCVALWQVSHGSLM